MNRLTLTVTSSRAKPVKIAADCQMCPNPTPLRVIPRTTISEATVKTHLLHIFAKLGVDDRTAAVTAAMERGMLRL